MTARFVRSAVEQIADWHWNLFVEPHIVAFVTVAGQYSNSPASFVVECAGISLRRLSKATELQLEVSWHKDTAEKAERMRATVQSGTLVELASIALALILVKRVVALGQLDVTDYGARADYRARRHRMVLEVSGTQTAAELGRRHREKVAQAKGNPFGWDAYVVVCAFASAGHCIRFSRHSVKEI
jgi:hypothetical protein